MWWNVRNKIISSFWFLKIWYWKTPMRWCEIKKACIYNHLLVKGQHLPQQKPDFGYPGKIL